MWAILADVHANLAAFTAVLEDATAHQCDRVLVLVDLVGYGPDPNECIDLARKTADVLLMGNFDHAVRSDDDLDGWGAQLAVRSIRWTREVIGRDRSDYLAGLPQTYMESEQLYVHGSACNPLNEYLFPEDVYNPRKLRRVFAASPRLTFCGHTHMPGAIVRTGEDSFAWIDHNERPVVKVGPEPLIVNVGSVGQPRDGDPRAGYVLFDRNQFTFRRVRYDIDATVQRIRAVPALDELLAQRLLEGR